MKHHRGISERFLKLIAYDPLAGLGRTKKPKRADGGRVNLASHIGEQAKAVDTSPTDGQKEAGNYRKGHVKVHGLDISIENPRGSWRSGVADGKPWKSRLPNHYGYIRKSESGDGDHLDVYLGPHLKSPHVFVIDQHELGSKRWDEHKAFIGFGSKVQAREAYHRAFSDGRGKDRIGHIETMTVDGFKDWLKNSDTTQPIKRASGGAVFGTQTPQELGEQEPNFLDRAVASGINSVATLPRRAIENSQHSLDTGTYDPGPTLEAAMLLMGTGAISGVPIRAGETVLGAGPIRAYHGSPHDFDKFSMDKIGTGEGAQAYGHGMYFAENEGVALDYRNRLAKSGDPSTYTWNGQEYAGRSGPEAHAVSLAYHDKPATSRRIAGEGLSAAKAGEPWAVEMGGVPYWEKMKAVADQIKSKKEIGHSQGRMYEVNINADPEHFLDWDKPLKDHHPTVREKFTPEALGLKPAGPIGERGYYGYVDDKGRLVGRAQTGKLPTNPFPESETPSSLIRGMGTWKPEEGSAALKQAGIPGIKYLDQGSRGAGEGSRNYVVFNDKLIDILKKYGIAGAAATSMADEIMSQGKQHFASGGRVHMAEGGTPNPFDQIDPPKPSTGNPFDAVDPPKPQEPDMGGMKAAWQGAKSGATFNFNDELAGVRGAAPNAVPEFFGPLPARTMVGAARLGANYFTGTDPEAITAYEKARDEERHTNELAKQQHPYLHMAGEVVGSLPAMAVLPEAKIAQGATGALKVAGKIAEGAITGGEYGALAGAGEGKDAASRVSGAAEGAGAGIIGGGIAGGATAGVEALARPVVGAIRAARDPEAEAARRLTRALQSDQELIAAGKAEGMSPQEWAAARRRGEPVTLADLGSSNTQALLRSAANTSPEGRAVLEKAFNDRFAGQTERVADEVRGLVAGGANANKTGDQLVAEYDKARVPAYKLAYQQGDKEIISPPIEHLMGSPLFEGAMKAAVNGVKDRAIAAGHTVPTNPSVTLENGMLKFTKAKPDGTPIYPNLQYWDAVKKELDGIATMAKRSGDPQGDVAANMSKVLRTELDKAVPSYGNARGIAAQYFGESNALEAGQKLAGKRVDPAQISDVMRKMKPDERDLFREGYASDWANRVISNISDTRDITKAMFNSPNERARALAVFGPTGMKTMESRMALETIMDGARKAMGNSTTARQLIEAGLAGGALGGYEGYDHYGVLGGLAGAVTGAVGARAGVKAIGSQVAAGAQKLIGKVDARTARLVADLLTSDDPRKLQQGLRMAQKNPRIAAGLNWMANKIGVAAQSGSDFGSRPLTHLIVRPVQGVTPGYADQKQQ